MISFIIPAYNAANTIKRTIDSILHQEEKGIDYEIIVVDDGSKDNLKEVINEYSKTNLEKIKYIYKENGGLSDARNYGLKNAKGEYVIFIDSDDYISKSLLQDIKKYIQKDIDLIKWSPIIVENGTQKKEPNLGYTTEVITGEEGFNTLFGKDNMLVCTWSYCIKKEICNEFPVGAYHEDFATTPFIILNAKTMIITDKYEYYYIQTESSITRGNDELKQRARLQDMLKHFDNMIEKTSKMNIQKQTKENIAIFGVNALLVNIPELEGDNKKYFEKELKKRNISQYIKIRNCKQLLKRIYISLKY